MRFGTQQVPSEKLRTPLLSVKYVSASTTYIFLRTSSPSSQLQCSRDLSGGVLHACFTFVIARSPTLLWGEQTSSLPVKCCLVGLSYFKLGYKFYILHFRPRRWLCHFVNMLLKGSLFEISNFFLSEEQCQCLITLKVTIDLVIWFCIHCCLKICVWFDIFRYQIHYTYRNTKKAVLFPLLMFGC